MAVNEHYAAAAREEIRNLYGDTADLSEEIVNTLCNIYYFANAARANRDFGGLLDLQKIHSEIEKESLLPMYLSHIAHVASAVEFLPDLIKNLRESRASGAGVYAVLEQLTLDLFKYQIKDADKKTGLRRSIERKFRRPNEYVGLARLSRVPFRTGRMTAAKGREEKEATPPPLKSSKLVSPQPAPSPVEEKSRPRRNETCACGSGMKYKHCCGRIR